MRAYNVMWARAKASEELITLTSQAEQRIHDIQERMARVKIQTTATK